MTTALPMWVLALCLAAVMVGLGMNLGVLAKPNLWSRCGACRRVVRRGRVCPCSRRYT